MSEVVVPRSVYKDVVFFVKRPEAVTVDSTQEVDIGFDAEARSESSYRSSVSALVEVVSAWNSIPCYGKTQGSVHTNCQGEAAEEELYVALLGNSTDIQQARSISDPFTWRLRESTEVKTVRDKFDPFRGDV